MSNTPVDFQNPEALDAALAEATAAQTAATTEKKPKEKKPRTIKVHYVATEAIAAGQAIDFDYELPISEGTRGAVAGIELVDMTDDQLKIEYRNANSVFYKQNKAKKDTTKSGERLDKVKAEMDARGIKTSTRGESAPITANVVADLIVNGKLDVTAIQALLDAANAAKEAATNAEV